MAAPQVGHGTTFTFSSGYIAQPLAHTQGGMERESLETTHYGTTGWRTYDPSPLVDPGFLEVRLKFDGLTLPPITGVKETLTVNYPGATGNSWVGEAFMISFEATHEGASHVETTARMKLSGAVTLA